MVGRSILLTPPPNTKKSGLAPSIAVPTISPLCTQEFCEVTPAGISHPGVSL